MPVQQVPNSDIASDLNRQNLLVNGGMEIWQRGNIGASSTTNFYGPDRWYAGGPGAPTTIALTADSANADPSGAGNCCKFDLAAASGVCVFYQKINTSSGIEHAQLHGRTVSFSVRVKTSVAGGAQADLYDGTINPQSAIHNGNGQYQTLTVTGVVTPGASELHCRVKLGINGTYYIDNACLVIGSQPVDYVPLDPALEFLRCQRYYEVTGGDNGVTSLGVWQAFTNINAYGPWIFKTRKVVAPTITFAGSGFQLKGAANVNLPVTSLSASQMHNDGCLFVAGASGGGLVAGNATLFEFTLVAQPGLKAESNP